MSSGNPKMRKDVRKAKHILYPMTDRKGLEMLREIAVQW